mmetsp:Transcript_31634/g.52322  ORF Transcript_31634/g.52322 Transcript_31634/m.52322 type:complete len:213 (+) Transcript_31634:999-1637(+)
MKSSAASPPLKKDMPTAKESVAAMSPPNVCRLCSYMVVIAPDDRTAPLSSLASIEPLPSSSIMSKMLLLSSSVHSTCNMSTSAQKPSKSSSRESRPPSSITSSIFPVWPRRATHTVRKRPLSTSVPTSGLARATVGFEGLACIHGATRSDLAFSGLHARSFSLSRMPESWAMPLTEPSRVWIGESALALARNPSIVVFAENAKCSCKHAFTG